MSILIIHKHGCSSSGQVLNLLKASGKRYKIRHYLDNPLTADEIKELSILGNIPVKQFLREKEEIWQEKYAGSDFKDEEILALIESNPILLQRPILKRGKKVLIARPAETAVKFIK